MTGFEHLQVLVSVVVGLALTNLLGGVGSTLKRTRRLYWVQSLWTLNLVLGMVLFWWFTYTDFAGIELFHPFAYIFVLLYAFAWYLPTRVLYPGPNENADLHTHFFSHRRVFFRLLMFLSVVDIFDTTLKIGFGYAAPEAQWVEGIMGFWGIWTLACLGANWYASRTENEWFHAGWAVAYLAGIVSWLMLQIPLSNE